MIATDVSKIWNAWLSPQGEWHTVITEGHDEYAGCVLQKGQSAMYREGWVKLSSGYWCDDQCDRVRRVTQAQLDEIVRWYTATNRTFTPQHFEVR